MNKPVYLGVAFLEISKIVMYEFWYDYLKLKYSEKAHWKALCHMNTNSLIVYIITNGIYIDIFKNVETRFDTSIRGKNKKVIELTKDEWRGIMTEFLVFRPKT